MRTKTFFQVCCVLSLLTTLAAGCSTSSMISSWTRPGIASKPYQKVLIVGLINEPDRSVREKIEINLADELRKLGYTAVCACEEFQPNTFYGLTEEQMLAQMEENSFDAAFTIVLLSKEKQIRQPAGMVSTSNYHQLWSYYQNAYDCVYQPVHYAESVTYFWETNLYDLEDHSQVYSAQTKSFDPTSVKNMAAQYSSSIINDMLKKNVLADQSVRKRAF